MDPTAIPSIPGIPEKLQLHILTAIVVFKLLGQFYSSIRTGGGLKLIVLRFWYGENVPAEVTKSIPLVNVNPSKE